MFVRDAGTFAQHLADSDGYAPFGDFANGSVRLHFGLTPRTADDDAAARDLEEAHDPALMGARVRAAIVAIELQEARRAAEFAAIGPQQYATGQTCRRLHRDHFPRSLAHGRPSFEQAAQESPLPRRR